MHDITERVMTEFNSSARILKYLDRHNQGVSIYLRQRLSTNANVKEPAPASSTGEPIRDRKRTVLQTERPKEIRTAVEINRDPRNWLLRRGARDSKYWDLNATLAFKKYLQEIYHFNDLHVVQNAVLYIGPPGMWENPAPIGVEIAAQWSTNRTVVQRNLVVVDKFNLFEQKRVGLLRLVSELIKDRLKLNDFSIVSRNDYGNWIIS